MVIFLYINYNFCDCRFLYKVVEKYGYLIYEVKILVTTININ